MRQKRFLKMYTKVAPGEIVKFGGGKTQKWKYWDIATIYHKKKQEKAGTYQEAKEALKRLLQDSVEKRMIADVPVGTFLSGGYDSSLVTALAQQASIEPVRTYSIGFRRNATMRRAMRRKWRSIWEQSIQNFILTKMPCFNGGEYSPIL